jgi:hypothetical protein
MLHLSTTLSNKRICNIARNSSAIRYLIRQRISSSSQLHSGIPREKSNRLGVAPITKFLIAEQMPVYICHWFVVAPATMFG